MIRNMNNSRSTCTCTCTSTSMNAMYQPVITMLLILPVLVVVVTVLLPFSETFSLQKTTVVSSFVLQRPVIQVVSRSVSSTTTTTTTTTKPLFLSSRVERIPFGTEATTTTTVLKKRKTVQQQQSASTSSTSASSVMFSRNYNLQKTLMKIRNSNSNSNTKNKQKLVNDNTALFSSSSIAVSDVLDQMLDKIISLDIPTSIGIPNIGGTTKGIESIGTTATTSSTTSPTSTSSIPKLTTNLIKQIVGGCILALPACVASFDTSINASTNDSIIPYSIAIIVVMGFINYYFFTILGRVCSVTGATTFQQAWDLSVGATATGTQSSTTTSSGTSSTPSTGTGITGTSTSTSSNKLISGILCMKTLLSCIAYAIILGDSFANLINNNQDVMLVPVVDHIISRSESLQYLSLSCLLPLCIQQDLSSLTPFSLIGLILILFTVVTIVIRSIDGTYTLAQTGSTSTGSENTLFDNLIDPVQVSTTIMNNLDNVVITTATTISESSIPTDISATVMSSLLDTTTTTTTNIIPDFNTIITSTNDIFNTVLTTTNIEFIQNTALFACTLITAFVAHYNAPRYYTELNNVDNNNSNDSTKNNIKPNNSGSIETTIGSSNKSTLQQFNTITGMSYGMATIIFGIVAITGYNTFGQSTLPFILNNYNDHDTLISLGNAAVTISICLTFPLPFIGLRDSILNIINVSPIDRSNRINNGIVTITLLAIIVSLASYITDLRSVLSIGGGTFSTAVAAVLPTLMFRAMVQNNNNNNSLQTKNDIDSTISTPTTVMGDSETQNNRNNNVVMNLLKNGISQQQQDQLEVNFALGLMSLCVAIGGTGVTIALQNAL